MRRSALDTTIDSVAGYLHRRRRSALALTTGEAATLAIGVVHGCAAAPSRADGGEWRLTAEGRPLLVDAPEGSDVMTATVAVLDELVSLVDDDVRRGFARLRDGVLTEPPPKWDVLTRRLLAVVEPRPLVLGPLTPVPSLDASRSAPEETLGDSPRLLGRVRDAVRGVRPRALLLGGGVTVALMVGVTATSSPSAPADADTAVRASAPSPSVSATTPDQTPTVSAGTPEQTPTPSPESPAPTGGDAPGKSDVGSEDAVTPAADVKAAARTILRSLASCADDVCSARLWEAQPREARRPLDPADADLDVIDDFGGVAVVRLATRTRTQYVTLVQHDEKWLVRSLAEADQPS